VIDDNGGADNGRNGCGEEVTDFALAAGEKITVSKQILPHKEVGVGFNSTITKLLFSLLQN